MGKDMYTRHLNDGMEGVDGLGQTIPSCIWGFGFIHNIDYHRWRSSLKRMLLQKINPRKHLKGKTRAKELDHDVGEMQKLLNEDGNRFPSDKESGTKQKRSLKARIKSLIAEEISKEGNGNQRGSSISSQPKLKRTYSIHHLEPPDHGLHEVCTDWEHPIFFFSNNKDTGPAKLWDLKSMNGIDKPDAGRKNSEEVKNKNASKDKVKEHANLREIFKVNKHLFLKSLQDTDDSLGKFSHTLPGSKAKARLTKSGSYPAANLLQKRNIEPSTMKQKQSEIWPAPKGEKLNNVSVIPKAEKFEYSMHSRSKSLPSEYRTKGSKLGQALNFILESSTESDDRNIVLVPCKESKQSEQSAETKGEDEVSNRYHSSVVEIDSDKRCGESATCRVDENNSLSSHETEEHCFSKSARVHRRSSSLTESLDKYARLLGNDGNDFGKEVKLGSSRSLRLRNEYEIGLGGNAPILFGRIRSLSHLESYSSFQNGVHGDGNLEDWPITTMEESSSYTDGSCQDELKHVGNSSNSEEVVPTGDIRESIKEYEILENVDNINEMANSSGPAEMDTTECDAAVEDLDEEAGSLMDGKSISFREKERGCSAIATNEFAQPCPVPAVETNFKEEVPSSSVEFQESEGLDNSGNQFDDDSSINCQKNFYVEPSSLSSTVQNLKILYDMKDAELGAFYKKHDTDLDYVKVLLEYSGFAKDALQKTWYSYNQPLGPSIFDEMEAYWHKELESSGEDCFGCYHHQLLFDIVNEKLLNIYDRSSTYYPKALSSSCHISPFPVGDHILDEVCKSISRLTSLKPEQKQSLEYIVGLDVGKDDGWMNLQLESECLLLELEDMIFDELMEDLEDMIFEQVFGS